MHNLRIAKSFSAEHSTTQLASQRFAFEQNDDSGQGGVVEGARSRGVCVVCVGASVKGVSGESVIEPLQRQLVSVEFTTAGYSLS